MLRRVALVRTDVSEESVASIIRAERIGKLGTMLEVTSNRSTARRNMFQLLAFANVVPRSPILFTLMMEVIHFLRNFGSYKNHTA
jgi:hypothetical protein